MYKRQVPNGVDLERFTPSLESTSDVTDKPKVIFLGRLWEQKNPQSFVKAAISILKDSGAIADFTLYGEGPEANLLNEMIEKSGYSDSIFVKKWSSKVAELLRESDILVLPSRWEGLPLVLIEGAAAGIARVASDIPGNRDCISHGVDGLLVELENDSELQDAIHSLIESIKLRTQFGIAARRRAEQEFNIDDRMQKMETIYLSLL